MVQDSGTWNNQKWQRQRAAGLWAAAPQRTPLCGAVAVVVTLAAVAEIPAPAGRPARDPAPGPHVPLPPRAADSDPLLLSQTAEGYKDPETAGW